MLVRARRVARPVPGALTSAQQCSRWTPLWRGSSFGEWTRGGLAPRDPSRCECPVVGSRMAVKKALPRTFVATDVQRSRAIDFLLSDADPLVRRASALAVERVMTADMAKWNRATLQKNVLWVIKFAAARAGSRHEAADQKAWAKLAKLEIRKLLVDPRAQGIGKPEGLTVSLVLAAMVAWAERPGRRGAGTHTDNTKRKEKAALALLTAVGLASNVTLEAIAKLIDRHVGRSEEGAIRAVPV